jgi:uncharacterized membrane protein YfcA
MVDTPGALAVVGAAFVLAGFVKGVIGLGLPTVAIGVLSVVMLPAQAAALLIIPSFVTNVWQLAAGPQLGTLSRRLWPMMAGILAGSWAGATLLGIDLAGGAVVALGVALVAYAALGLSEIRFYVPTQAEGWLAPVIGLASGVVTAATGVFVLPGVPYIQALGLPKDDLVQALGLFFTISTVALAGALLGGGLLDSSILWASALALAAALAGMGIGQKVRGRVSERTFRRCFFAGMLMLGAHLAGRALF